MIMDYGIVSDGLYKEESLLVLRGLGVQTSTSSSSYFAPATTRFIPTTQVQDIVIHEAFRGFEVKFYLAIIVEGESEVVVVFPVWLLPLQLPLHPTNRSRTYCHGVSFSRKFGRARANAFPNQAHDPSAQMCCSI